MLCTHTDLTPRGNGLEVESYFVSPSGTLDWICQSCKTRVHSKEHVDKITHYWAKNPMEWLKQSNSMIR